ncbi:collagen alpha-1(I) chain-like [Hetaerina americana]|uniref:collagen alpha-1(I) chain-like n=1 Tax=Hetaerina americana TaxID=62018 RepID=UPI003A7F3756
MPSRGGGVRLARQAPSSMRPPSALSSRPTVCSLAVEPSPSSDSGSPQPMVAGSPTPPPQHSDRRLAAALAGEADETPSGGLKAPPTRTPPDSPAAREPASNGMTRGTGAVNKEERRGVDGGGALKTREEDGGAGMDLKDAPEAVHLGDPATPRSHTGYSSFSGDGGEGEVVGADSVVDEQGMVVERVGPGSGAVGVEDPWGEGGDAPPGSEDNQLTTLTAVDTMDCTHDVTVEGVAYAARGDPATTDGGVVTAPGGHFVSGGNGSGGGSAGDPPSVLVIGGGSGDNRKIVGLEEFMPDEGDPLDQRGRVLPGGGYVHIGTMMTDGGDEFISGDVGDDSVVVVLGPDGRVTESIRLGDMQRMGQEGPRDAGSARLGTPMQVGGGRTGRLPSLGGLGAHSSVVRNAAGVDVGKQSAVRLPPFERTVIQRSSNQQQQLCDALTLGQTVGAC